jgi:hypothetical protein
MKNILIAIAVVMISVVFVAAGVAAVSSPCSGYTKPKAAPVKSAPIEQDYRRDVLGQKVPVYTHEAGDALTDTATKYETQLVTGEK